MPDNQTQAAAVLKRPASPVQGVQQGVGKAAKFADGSTRSWMLFFFFRILPQAEISRMAERFKAFQEVAAKSGKRSGRDSRQLLEIFSQFADPALMNADSNVQEGADNPNDRREEPADFFLNWLKILTGADNDTLAMQVGAYRKIAKKIVQGLDVKDPESEVEFVLGVLSEFEARTHEEIAAEFARNPEDARRIILHLNRILPVAIARPASLEKMLRAFALLLPRLRNEPERFASIQEALVVSVCKIMADDDFATNFIGAFGDTPSRAGLRALEGRLPLVSLFELLRQAAPARRGRGRKLAAAICGEGEGPAARANAGFDSIPVNVAFTHSGLSALKLNQTTLDSFPDVFKEGMAARAERLGDTGPSAPDHWDGALGLKRIHGYFTGGFQVGGAGEPVKAVLWERLQDDVAAFNDRTGTWGRFLRLFINTLMRPMGMEILQIELGQDPYEVDGDGYAVLPPYRLEHFGFRDGISQPFVDMKLGDPLPGGGTPRRNRTWEQIAPGEIYLGEPDADGQVHKQPVSPELRDGGTFLVFRKLEQDVAGFRTFLREQRPDDNAAQDKLAAQFMGRWRNGTPLVSAPDAPLDLGSDRDGLLNDFLFAADDPEGRKCPLAAHVRRSNPRDIGGTGDVRRHRILRRSMAYGGSLLPHDRLGDGRKRGLLFVAANSRIDLQFEVVQSNWINGGEFLGQVGLGRCPVTGANNGEVSDSFLESGAVAPVTRIPRFVITRGGDYFFAPSVRALAMISLGHDFRVNDCDLPFLGHSMGDAQTPKLFDPDNPERLTDYGRQILTGKSKVIRIPMPDVETGSNNTIPDPYALPVAFVGRHADVKHVLSAVQQGRPGKAVFSVAHYGLAGRWLSGGSDLIIGTEAGSPSAAKRKRMHFILERAWQALNHDRKLHNRLECSVDDQIADTLRRTGPAMSIDLVRDLAADAVYRVLVDVFGTPGPSWLTEIAVALPFAKQHVGQLYPDWLRGLAGRKIENVGFTTMQVWSALLFADIVGNVLGARELRLLSRQAGSEFLTHVDRLLIDAQDKRPPDPGNLVDAFVSIDKLCVTRFGYSYEEYYGDVRMLLMELIGSALAIIPTTFGAVMDALLEFGIDLPGLLPVLQRPPRFNDTDPNGSTSDGIQRLIYETSRVRPTFGMLMRLCNQTTRLPSGAVVRRGEWIGALVKAANFDPGTKQRPVFTEPERFSLYPYLPGPERRKADYLLFGAAGGQRDCWGRDRLALFVLERCIKAAGRLEGLRRVAGPNGELRDLIGVNLGLQARFVSVLPQP